MLCGMVCVAMFVIAVSVSECVVVLVFLYGCVLCCYVLCCVCCDVVFVVFGEVCSSLLRSVVVDWLFGCLFV